MCEKVDDFWLVIHQKDILKKREGRVNFLKKISSEFII